MKYETECKYLKYFNLKIYKSHNLGEKNKQMQDQNQEFLKIQGIVHKILSLNEIYHHIIQMSLKRKMRT